MIAGLIACLVALAAATAIGVGWRSRNGKMREPRRLPRVVPGSAEDGGATVGQAGQLEPVTGRRLTSAEIGQPLGTGATLLQFSSAFCAPCRATRRILAEVAVMTDGVAHIEIDAESRLDLVRNLAVLRTPTVFVLGPGGEIVRRASGQPRKPDVIAALGTAIQGADSYTSGRESG